MGQKVKNAMASGGKVKEMARGGRSSRSSSNCYNAGGLAGAGMGAGAGHAAGQMKGKRMAKGGSVRGR